MEIIRISKLFNIPNHSKRVRYKKISNKLGDKIKVQGGISEFKVSDEYLYNNSYVKISMGNGRSLYNNISAYGLNYNRFVKFQPIKIIIDKNNIIKSINIEFPKKTIFTKVFYYEKVFIIKPPIDWFSKGLYSKKSISTEFISRSSENQFETTSLAHKNALKELSKIGVKEGKKITFDSKTKKIIDIMFEYQNIIKNKSVK